MVLGFYPPQIPPGWLPSQPPRAFFAFGFWVFTRLKSLQVRCLTNPPRFLCFLFLGFNLPQIPLVGCLPNLPALSLLSVFGVLPAPYSPRLVAFPTPRAFFAFGFWGFTRQKSPQVGCLPNPPRLLCFRFLGFHPPQIPPGWLPSQPPALSLHRFLGFYPPQIPPGWLPSQPPALSLLSVFGVLPAPNPPRLVAFPPPPRFLCFRFWGFTRPKSPQVGCLPNPPRFLCFRFLGFYPTQTPTGWLPSQPHALSSISSFGVLSAPNSPVSFLSDHSRYLSLSSTTEFDYYLNLSAFH